MSVSIDEDLLQPTLTEDADLTGFKKPWSPWNLVFVTFFAGPIGGGYLMTMNFDRLGQRRHMGWSALLFTLITLGGVAYGLYRYFHDGADAASDSDTVRLVARAVTLAAAALVASVQSKRFRVFIGGAGEPAPLLVPGLLAVAIGFAVMYVLYFVGALLVGGP